MLTRSQAIKWKSLLRAKAYICDGHDFVSNKRNVLPDFGSLSDDNNPNRESNNRAVVIRLDEVQTLQKKKSCK